MFCIFSYDCDQGKQNEKVMLRTFENARKYRTFVEIYYVVRGKGTNIARKSGIKLEKDKKQDIFCTRRQKSSNEKVLLFR